MITDSDGHMLTKFQKYRKFDCKAILLEYLKEKEAIIKINSDDFMKMLSDQSPFMTEIFAKNWTKGIYYLKSEKEKVKLYGKIKNSRPSLLVEISHIMGVEFLDEFLIVSMADNQFTREDLEKYINFDCDEDEKHMITIETSPTAFNIQIGSNELENLLESFMEKNVNK